MAGGTLGAVSFLFGVRGREDPELKAANRRTEIHYARDINDERVLADDRPPIRRGRPWTWLGVAAVGLVVAGFVGGHRAEDVPLPANCDTAGIGVASSAVTAGEALRFRLTGPDGVRYVVTLDGQPVRGDAGSTVSYTESAAGPLLELQQCLSPTLLLAAPAGDGPHQLAMRAVDDAGTTRPVAEVTITVSGTG